MNEVLHSTIISFLSYWTKQSNYSICRVEKSELKLFKSKSIKSIVFRNKCLFHQINIFYRCAYNISSLKTVKHFLKFCKEIYIKMSLGCFIVGYIEL